MAWTGVATVKQVSDRCVRVTGLSLAGGATGTIGFSDRTVPADVELGTLPVWQPYDHPVGGLISLIDRVKVAIEAADDDVVSAVPISVIKTGTDHEDFLITFHNDTVATLSPDLEIYVELEC